MYSTDREPDATLLKACGNRRASVCPSCSATYQADSFQLLAAGLRGGKGVPETVAAHPRLFVTFTAPSLRPGPHPQGPRAAGATPAIPTGRASGARMAAGWAAGSATTRTTLGWASRCVPAATRPAPKCCGTPWPGGCGRGPPSTVYRALAQLAGVPRGRAAAAGADLVRQGGRVPEARGGPLPRHHPPGRRHRLRLPGLCGPAAGRVHRRAARGRPSGRPPPTVARALPGPGRGPGRDPGCPLGRAARRAPHHRAGDGGELSAEQVAGYVAKYATKGTEALGVTLDHRVGEVELEGLDAAGPCG